MATPATAFAARVRDAQNWLKSVLNRELPGNVDFFLAIRDGVLICEALLKVAPEGTTLAYNPTPSNAMQMKANLDKFQAACAQLGLKGKFVSNDITTHATGGNSYPKLIDMIHELADYAYQAGKSAPINKQAGSPFVKRETVSQMDTSEDKPAKAAPASPSPAAPVKPAAATSAPAPVQAPAPAATKAPEKMVDDQPSAKKDEKEKGKKKKGKDAEVELSAEDQQLKLDLEMLVQRVSDPSADLQRAALVALRDQLLTSASSMTSVPKPLKFLRPHYAALKAAFDQVDSSNRAALADILSVLAMTTAPEDSLESLKLKLQGNRSDLAPWGHEYVRNLCGEITRDYAARTAGEQRDEAGIAELMTLVNHIVPFLIKQNAEHEACDILMEVEQLPMIVEFSDAKNFSRLCLYLTQCATYVAEPEDSEILRIIITIFRRHNQFHSALRIALRLNDIKLATEIFMSCEDPLLQRQLAFLLARHNTVLSDVADEDLVGVMSNRSLSEHFLSLCRDLDVLDPKTPDDIYKLESKTSAQDSARLNLASSFVNGFVNSGFGSDKLLLPPDSKWLTKNKEHGLISTAASLGMILQWNIAEGLNQIDKFIYSNDDNVKAGGLMAIGLVSCGVRSEHDPAFAIISEHVGAKSPQVRVGSILGLGLAYAGTRREDVVETLLVALNDHTVGIETSAYAALAIGMIFSGSSNGEYAQAFIHTPNQTTSTHFLFPGSLKRFRKIQMRRRLRHSLGFSGLVSACCTSHAARSPTSSKRHCKQCFLDHLSTTLSPPWKPAHMHAAAMYC
eukprot:TRINITY_DN2013_c0_g1_i2.p1 TRINITY_DN2013_c0_g1~~TRINITY_DN2013_c0_g1_i2.p1  ORF type:complete len:792 (+),score=204.02 TRINITY_DN2013_c0_g1_i2:2-2377(+)